MDLGDIFYMFFTETHKNFMPYPIVNKIGFFKLLSPLKTENRGFSMKLNSEEKNNEN